MAKGRVARKKIAITAAGQGIGRASALALAREGAEVWASDINSEALASLVSDAAREGLVIQQAVVDVREQAAVDAFARELGAVDGLFNCAGFVASGNILECSEADWDFSMDLNVKAMYRTTRAFLPAMLENGGGSIVNMSSAASSVKGVPNRFAYGASKAAVAALVVYLLSDESSFTTGTTHMIDGGWLN